MEIKVGEFYKTRDEMAMAALVMCSPDSSDTVASYAYAIADAMLIAREEKAE